MVFSLPPENLTRSGLQEYVTDPYFDEKTGEFYHDGMKKPMPTFSDFHIKLEEYGIKNNEKNKIQYIKSEKNYGFPNMFI